MAIKDHSYRTLSALLCALALGACATAPLPVAKLAPPKMDELMAQATQASHAGLNEKAIALYQGAATSYPADKAPWLQIAQMKFDAGQYSQAISNAQETLARDPNDKLANSIIAISGLRLATRALSELSRQNNLSGSLKSESQDLAKLLRESLGETVLVPLREKAPTRAASSKKVGTKPPDDDLKANPFGALR